MPERVIQGAILIVRGCSRLFANIDRGVLMLMPELLREVAGVAPRVVETRLVEISAMRQQGLRRAITMRPGVAPVGAMRRATHRRVSCAAVEGIMRRMAYIGIVSGFTAAPALCLVGVACLVLPVAQALQGSAGAFIILGALWTTLAILMTNFRSVGPHV